MPIPYTYLGRIMNDKEIQEIEKRIKQLRFKLSYVTGEERIKVSKEYEKLMFGKL